jgi:hypothetical protein
MSEYDVGPEVLALLKKHMKDMQNGYVALHDKSGQVIAKCEVTDALYTEWMAGFSDEHGPGEGEVDPSGPLDEDLYSETSTGTDVDESSIDTSGETRPDEVE